MEGGNEVRNLRRRGRGRETIEEKLVGGSKRERGRKRRRERKEGKKEGEREGRKEGERDEKANRRKRRGIEQTPWQG